MNILHIYKDYYPVLGGMENHIRTLAEAQAQRGHTVTVLATARGRRSEEETLNGVRIIKAARLATVASTPLSAELPRRLRALRPDLTHLHLPYPVGELAQLFWGRGRKYVVTYHAEATRPLQRLIMLGYAPFFRRVLRGAACVLATSPNYMRTSPFLRVLGDHVSIVPLGSDPQRFAPGLRSNDQPFAILFVGVLRHYKGVDDLIRALALLPEPARLVIGGAGPLRAEWEGLGDRLGLTGRIRFLGRVPDEDLPALYQSADVLVLPALNRAEAFGTVLVEAMLSGLPCVTTEIGSGTSYVVEEGVTGFVVPPRTPQALAHALTRLLTEPALRAQFGTAGRERALKLFTVDRMLAQVEGIYAEVLRR
jgi:rhamnosyl/mannosyltransferase